MAENRDDIPGWRSLADKLSQRTSDMAKKILKKLLSKWYFRCLCYILILVSLSGVVTIMNLDRLLFPTPPPTPVSGNCQLNAGAAVLDALWLEGQKDHPVILYSHGNYETLQDMRSLCYEFRLQGYSVLAYDYAGYGASTGKPLEKQAYLDIEAAYDYLLREKGVSPENIIAVGYSVGTGPSCHLAAKHDIKALVLCAPFASAIRVALPFSLPGDKFKNVDKLSSKEIPVLMFHGKKDEIIPYRNAKLLYKKALGPKRLVTIADAGHNNLFYHLGDQFWSEIAKFLEEMD